MSTTLQRAELESGRILTFVADDEAETVDDAPRVYLGSQTDLVHEGAESRYVTRPTVDFGELGFTPEQAEELARRLMIAAASVRARCACGHQWWEHYQGRSCDHTGDTPVPPAVVEPPKVCLCGLFTHQIAQAQ